MNSKQIILLAVFLPLTLLILILSNIFPGAFIVDFLKRGSIIALFFTALIIKKKFSEQKILTLAVFFSVLGDLSLFLNQAVLGIVSFILAYLILIVICQRKPKVTWAGIKINPILIILYVMFLIYIVWASIRTIFIGYYSRKVSFLFAAAGVLIFISDLAVTADLSITNLTVPASRWLDNIIWATYIPAWTLITLNIAEDEFYLNP